MQKGKTSAANEGAPAGLSLFAVVLAGGLAERMGECKILLPIGERSALDILTSRMRAAGIGGIVAVTGGHEEKIRPEALRLGLEITHNPAYESGMFSSVLAGIDALPADIDAFFLLPADTPLVKPSTYRALAAAFAGLRASSRIDVLYPTFKGERGHPPLISRDLAGKIKEWSGEGGLRGMFEESWVRWSEVRTADRAVLLDMDTQEDYTALKKYAQNEHIPDEEEHAELIEIGDYA